MQQTIYKTGTTVVSYFKNSKKNAAAKLCKSKSKQYYKQQVHSMSGLLQALFLALLLSQTETRAATYIKALSFTELPGHDQTGRQSGAQTQDRGVFDPLQLFQNPTPSFQYSSLKLLTFSPLGEENHTGRIVGNCWGQGEEGREGGEK